jgi:EAL domain-containing protein (putative c-di-GMP-specific phosphodiesterase class I)
MRRRAFEDLDTSQSEARTTNVSGVHTSSTGSSTSERVSIGSIPVAELAADFQPIVNLHTGETCGYEVLPRCMLEELAEPAELYARAMFEKTVGELGRAIRTIAVRESPSSTLYLPLHPGELKDRHLIRPDDPICSHDAQIFFQLSQSSLSSVALQMLRELSTRGGIGIAIDDLGAGPATLKQLVELAPAVIKIDRELLVGIDRSARKQVVVRAVVTMGEQLGARVLAKGLDTEAALETAMACGVVFGQGSVLGEPTPMPAISMWPPAK